MDMKQSIVVDYLSEGDVTARAFAFVEARD